MRFSLLATRSRSAVAAFAISILVCGCRSGGGSEGPTSPSGSGGSAPAAGTWTGTFARPGALEAFSIRWEVTTNADGLLGPMTLTNGGQSVTVQTRGSTGGNDQQGYTIHLSFTSTEGDFPAFPNCKMNGSSASTNQAGDPFPSPYTSITAPTFQMASTNCRGFIDTGYSSPLGNFTQETGQLSLRKQ